MSERFNHNSYLIRRKVLKLVGGAFHVYNPAGVVEFYVKQKAFKLKEDIRVFTGEDMQEEVLLIQARNAIDFSATYDVVDSSTGYRIGSFKRKGMKSLIKDEWMIFDANENQIGLIEEDSTGLAIVRRFLLNLIPQTFVGSAFGQPVFTFKQRFNPFVHRIELDFSVDTNNVLDRRLGIAAAVLLSAIEGRQN
jgi:uncharacterized protein YxjI